MIELGDVRAELQITSAVISDNDINYVINKLEDDLNLVCAEVLRMVLRKHRGLVVRHVGKYREEINPGEIRNQINAFMNKAASSVMDDGYVEPDAFFTRDTI